jgi:rhodanese-related sulfurtransferase
MSLSLPWAKLSTHQRLASIATVLGFLAIFAGSPYSGSLDRIARDAAEGTPQMAPLALAAAIRAQDGVIVIDARDSTAFADDHIPSATNLPLGMLAESRFSPRERVVVYAATDADATAAWLVLRAKGVRDVALVAGGLDGWLFRRDGAVARSAGVSRGAESVRGDRRARTLLRTASKKGRGSGIDRRAQRECIDGPVIKSRRDTTARAPELRCSLGRAATTAAAHPSSSARSISWSRNVSAVISRSRCCHANAIRKFCAT